LKTLIASSITASRNPQIRMLRNKKSTQRRSSVADPARMRMRTPRRRSRTRRRTRRRRRGAHLL
jgi:hypothetical protein